MKSLGSRVGDDDDDDDHHHHHLSVGEPHRSPVSLASINIVFIYNSNSNNYYIILMMQYLYNLYS